MNNIYVTKSFLPPKEEYNKYIEKIWDSSQLTNNGPLLNEFEDKIKAYLGVHNFQFVTNGTLALQIAIRAFEFEEGEIITTPFSYVATSSAILWEGFTPVYADISPDTLCIDPDKIEKLITPKTRAIIPTHVFGNVCDIDGIQKIADKHSLKVIYDAAHSFGTKHSDNSVFAYGDISITSFHATKLYHTIEGGGIFTENADLSSKVDLLKRFGHNGDDHRVLGINAKASEFQAAMGLCNINYIDAIIEDRKRAYTKYDKLISNDASRQKITNVDSYNHAYFPIILDKESVTTKIIEELNKNNIYPRRYFYPSLNKLKYLKNHYSCPVSESITERVLCLPIHYEISDDDIERIVSIVNRVINEE